ncbi:MAG: L,D-transpeptidase [Polyangiaceae bacterium]
MWPKANSWIWLSLWPLAVWSCHAADDDAPSPPNPQPQAAAPRSKVATPGAKTRADGTKRAPARATPRAKQDEKPRIYALDLRVYIRERPSDASPEIGALRIGQGVTLRSQRAVKGAGCENPGKGTPSKAGWFPVEPEGYVCLDRTTTLDEKHPLLVAKAGHQADFTKDAPVRWGESLEAPVYRRYPTEKEQKRSEYQLEKHLARVNAVREARSGGEKAPPRALARLRGADPSLVKAPLPPYLEEHQDSPWATAIWPGNAPPRMSFVPPRSSISWIDEFQADGRSWLVTPELTVVPKDRILELEPAKFHGVFIGKDAELPLAYMRFDDRAKWRLDSAQARAEEQPELIPVVAKESDEAADEQTDDEAAEDASSPWRVDPPGSDGRLVKTEQTWKRLSHVELTGRVRYQHGKRFLETREAGMWVLQKDTAVIRAWEPRGIPLEKNEKWLDVSIYQGTLVAYEGTRPVFATLISPGLNGYRSRTGPVKKNTTPSGTFRIEWKHLATTMSPDPEKKRYYLTDVPFTQFFHMPFALHAAYWHDRFGEPKSGGCVNLSVRDARWLFGFTEPHLPDGWQSVRSGGDRGEGTWVRVR